MPRFARLRTSSKEEFIREPLIRPKMPELDTIRGIAILLVVFFHGFYARPASAFAFPARLFLLLTRTGWVGVNLFFVLSGFLITGILLDSRERAAYYKRFYIHRALRILPAYYLFLIVLLVGPRMGLVDQRHISWPFIGLSFIYLSNVTVLFGVPLQYGPLWSLAVEEHFYLLWPATVRVCSRNVFGLLGDRYRGNVPCAASDCLHARV